MVDVIGYDKNSDGSIFANSNFGICLREEKLNFPTEEAMPYVIVGNKTFPLHNNQMRLYPGNELLNNEDKTFSTTDSAGREIQVMIDLAF